MFRQFCFTICLCLLICLYHSPHTNTHMSTPKDPKTRGNCQKLSRHCRSSEASWAGSGPLQRGVWEVTGWGGEAKGSTKGGWSGQIVQGEENYWSWEVRVKKSVTLKSTPTHAPSGCSQRVVLFLLTGSL